RFRFTARIIGYIAVLLVLLTTLITLLVLRSDVETTVLRTPGQMYQQLTDGTISNLYNIQIVNKTFNDLPLDVDLVSPAGEIRYVGQELNMVRQDSLAEGVFFIVLDRNQIHQIKTPVVISVKSAGKEIDRVETNFMGPNTKQ
ncbi:MAG TPA: FixG Ig-like domain-containing protein, partial [Bacteroidia bacterium]|nr:FixG Ig-like domain-containing protein [Bacteroidia bacterium]